MCVRGVGEGREGVSGLALGRPAGVGGLGLVLPLIHLCSQLGIMMRGMLFSRWVNGDSICGRHGGVIQIQSE